MFPLLLWIFKRAGWVAGVVAGFAIGFSVFLFTTPRVAEVMFCWYVGLFALGMAAAHAVTEKSVTTSFGAKVPWLALAAVVAISSHILTEKRAPPWLTDSIVGVATALLLVGCARQPIRDDRAQSVALRILTWPPLVAVGHFSYSLYLIHNPILEIFDGWFVSRGLGYAPRMLGLMFLATPTCIALAWLFFQAFEKPFIRTSRSVLVSTDTRIKLALQA